MSGNGCGSGYGESSPGLAIHNEPVISGADTGGNLTVFLDQAGRHAGGSAVLELSMPNTGSAAECRNGSSTKPRICDYISDFDKGSNSIDDSVLDRAHPDLTGMCCLLW